MFRSAFAIPVLLLLSLAAHASPAGLGDAAPYNVFTFGNLSSSSDIAGRVAVGGYLNSNLQDGSNNEYTRFSSSAVFTDLANGNGAYNVTENNGGSVYASTRGSGRHGKHPHLCQRAQSY
jgi:choice-of-anchor A domain-containing protein